MPGKTLIHSVLPLDVTLLKDASPGSAASTLKMSLGLSVLARFSISALLAEPSLSQLSGAAAAAGSTEKPAPTLAT